MVFQKWFTFVTEDQIWEKGPLLWLETKFDKKITSARKAKTENAPLARVFELHTSIFVGFRSLHS